MNKTKLSLIALLVALALFFSVNLASGALFKSTRVDLTENKLFTLSEGTKNLLRGLQEPVTLRFYYSKKLATEDSSLTPINDYAKRIQEMLQEYESYAGGKLSFFSIDPEPFSEEEDRAVGFGLQGAPLNRAGEVLYCGLAGTNTTDGQEVIPFFTLEREEFLEYDLTQLVYKLGYSDKTVVGVLSALPLDGGFDPSNPMKPSKAWRIMDQIRQLSDVRTIETSVKELPKDLDVLVVVHPKEFSQELLYAIDQFVLGGGKLICFMDPHCEADPVPQDPNNPLAGVSANRSSTLGPLLTAWGVEMPKDKVIGDRDYALQVGYQNQGVDYVVFLGFPKEAMNQEDPITGQLELVRMGTAGILRPTADAKTTFTPLIQTSEDSMEVDRMSVALYPDPNKLLSDFIASGKRMTVAARVSGKVNTAFPDGPPDGAKKDGTTPTDGGGEEDTDDESGQLKEGDINVLLVSDADMLANQWWAREINFLGQVLVNPTANNADFLVNAIDNMSGSKDLISLRSRPSFGRPFDVVADIRRRAEERYRDQEDQLETKLKDIEKTINDLQAQKGDGVSAMILSPEQREQIEEARKEQVATRAKLRDVKHSLKKEIDGLGLRLKFLNILGVPLLVAALALGLWFVNSRRTHQ